MLVFDTLAIGGTWVPSEGEGTIEVVDPTTEEIYASIPAGVPTDVDRAVAAARASFPTWSEVPPLERATLLAKVAEELEARRDAIAEVITHEVGMPKRQSASIQVGTGIVAFATAAELAKTYPFEDTTHGLIVREPVGVVGCITPWNYPLNQIGAKVAYALAAGCTVVLKPSEVAPVNAFILAEILHEIFPPGVFNLVTGLGPVVGEALARHPDVDMMSFTGSARAGTRVAELASGTVKRISLELGGKSPNVLLDDADFDKAVPNGVAASYYNSGQTCNALTRMLVPRSELHRVEELARAAAEAYTIGDPFADGIRLGPLVSAVQRDRVRSYIETGIAEGATLITGGAEQPEGLDHGYFVSPTVFSAVTSDMVIAREEIFGPVLSIMPYDTEDEAVAIANDTPYGLAGSVWGSSERANSVARRIRAGQVSINGGRAQGDTPFGGYKQSGMGREHGAFGLEEFLEVKAILV